MTNSPEKTKSLVARWISWTVTAVGWLTVGVGIDDHFVRKCGLVLVFIGLIGMGVYLLRASSVTKQRRGVE